MRQVRTALGKNSHNVQRLLLLENFNMAQDFQSYLLDYPKMSIFTTNSTVKNAVNKTLVDTFKKAVESIYQRIFIIDPHGNLMMFYPQNMEPKDLLSDLKRLILVNNNS